MPGRDYPTGRILAVLDDEPAEARAIAALAAVGIDEADVERLAGTTAADDLDATGGRGGLLARARRVVQFGLMDQMPTLAWYEAALRDGRLVLSVRAGSGGGPVVADVVDALRGAGGHFINGFGRFSTQEHARWRGPEPRVPELLR